MIFSDLKKRSGFTLVEIILSIAIITILSGIGIPVYQSLQSRNDLDLTVDAWAQSLRRAQILSRAVDSDTSWGVHVQGGETTLFKGTSYAARDEGFDETFTVPGIISGSGITEVVFAKFTGLPQTTGSTTFSTAYDSRVVTISSKGTVDY